MYILTHTTVIPPDTNVHIIINTTVHTTRYQCTKYHTYNRPYHQIPMYILTHTTVIPPDSNVHINIDTTVHTTRYQCTY